MQYLHVHHTTPAADVHMISGGTVDIQCTTFIDKQCTSIWIIQFKGIQNICFIRDIDPNFCMSKGRLSNTRFFAKIAIYLNIA